MTKPVQTLKEKIMQMILSYSVKRVNNEREYLKGKVSGNDFVEKDVADLNRLAVEIIELVKKEKDNV